MDNKPPTQRTKGVEARELDEGTNSEPIYNQKDLTIKDVELVVDLVKNMKEDGLIGGNSSHIAMKNHNSFAVGTSYAGLKVIENCQHLYSGKLPQGHRILKDIIYASSLNCYFLVTSSKILRKDINRKTPYVYMTVKCGGRSGACINYSNIYHKLVISKDWKTISLIDLRIRKIGINLGTSCESYINCFKLFGKKDDKVVAVTFDGNVVVYSLDKGQKRGEIARNQIEIERRGDRQDLPLSIAVCNRNQYVLIEVGIT